MPGKEGGKAKPLKQAKAKAKNLTDDDIAFKNKQKADKAADAAYAKQLAAGKKKKK
eukprot:CAMPEP_0175100312 /NCGR_PEP_ID=MMETSP0086_2-20121207/7021_1 /TAXON_ID=136419 /ORGANISM="Unknown Unknown, Strain D1" /LENGTH=55 /DNA_ID=CAMNT_0016374417 /DNA_START=33 /DNA_END=200 /DNA_ORIENTATION=+